MDGGTTHREQDWGWGGKQVLGWGVCGMFQDLQLGAAKEKQVKEKQCLDANFIPKSKGFSKKKKPKKKRIFQKRLRRICQRKEEKGQKAFKNPKRERVSKNAEWSQCQMLQRGQ